VAPFPGKRVDEEGGRGFERVPGRHGGRAAMAGMGEQVVPLTTCEDSVLCTHIKIQFGPHRGHRVLPL